MFYAVHERQLSSDAGRTFAAWIFAHRSLRNEYYRVVTQYSNLDGRHMARCSAVSDRHIAGMRHVVTSCGTSTANSAYVSRGFALGFIWFAGGLVIVRDV